ncbi:hypothetical protein [Streptococcus mutans]|uniref:hypothetical protein n=1 Tax=Streptococcus mutans TaxID=1309 RepID=UPI0002B5FB64|nr:hypothetical protein [Streptococcus mutans]EMB76028.1 hypothetical protein SMU41_04816 [Streptococcus mutans 2VS1]
MHYLKSFFYLGLPFLLLISFVQPITADSIASNGSSLNGNSQADIGPDNSQYQTPAQKEIQGVQAKSKQKEAKKEKKVADTLTADEDYQKASKADDRLQKYYKKENPSEAEMQKAIKDYNTIEKFLHDKSNEKKYKDSTKWQSLSANFESYNTKISAVKDGVKAIAEAQKKYEKAMTSKDPADLAILTSYFYGEDGWFGVKDIFPKAVNSLIQGIFFLGKMIYLLVVIILEAVFGTNFYAFLDKAVELSGNAFNHIMDAYGVYIFMATGLLGVLEFARKGKIPLKLFQFFLIWLVALFLYQPSNFNTDVDHSEITASYNLSKVVKIVDVVSSELSGQAIKGLGLLDGQKQNSQSSAPVSTAEGFQALRKTIFKEMVLEPFYSLNFSADFIQNSTSDDLDAAVNKLISTRGTSDNVKNFAESKDYKGQTTLNWSAIGVKFLVALAALAKAIILGGALIILGLVSVVFKYLVLIIIAMSMLLFFIALLPKLDYVLGNTLKKIVQYAFVGGLGLFGVTLFIWINSLIGVAADSFSGGVYYWSALLEGIIWFLIYLFRGSIASLFSKGGMRLHDLTSAAQFRLNKFYRPSHFEADREGLKRQLKRSQVKEMLPVNQRQPSRFRTLLRASRAGTEQLYDRLRYGAGSNPQKRYIQQNRAERRKNFKQMLQDRKEALQDHAVNLMTFAQPRAFIHDLAGDEDTPIQRQVSERSQRQVERLNRKQAGEQAYMEDLRAMKRLKGQRSFKDMSAKQERQAVKNFKQEAYLRKHGVIDMDTVRRDRVNRHLDRVEARRERLRRTQLRQQEKIKQSLFQT